MKGTILAAALAAGLIITTASANAADLGGNCCADLEDRIAELEATTARKGNRKMSLTVYGSVNQALLWADIDGESDSAIGNNANFSSRFGFKGETKVREGFKAGFVIEVGVGGFDADAGSFDDYLSNDIGLRHAFVYVDTGVGKFAIGQASSATDGIAEITIANTVAASKLLSFEHLGIPAVFDGGRGHAVRYDTPSLAGFVGSASITSDESTQFAVRWSGEGAGFKMAAGVGYEESATIAVDAIGLTLALPGVERLSGSASVMHVTTGLFVNAAYGQLGDDALRGYHVQGGIEHKFNPIGATTLFGEGLRLDIDGETVDFIGAGMVQRIDGAAMDLYASIRHSRDADISIGLVGAKIDF